MQQSGVFDLTHISFEGASRRDAARGVAPPRPPAWRPGPPARGTPAEETGAEFARRMLARAGIDGCQYRAASLRRRTAACLRALKVRSENAAAALVEDHPARLPAALDALLVGVTRFFRDPEVYQALQALVLPVLAARGGPIRVWVAGCSSGAEVYSLAMLLADANLLARAQMLGTDCRPDAIAQAHAATYPDSMMADVPPPARSAYWRRAHGGWRPVDRLSSAVRWKVADLTRDIEPGPWDVLLSRNVSIYLNPEPARRLACGLTSVLRTGGYLVVGKAERPAIDLGLERVAPCVYQRNQAR